MYTEEEAAHVAADRGWVVKPDGTGWRRVVGSPRPQRVVETRLIRLLLESGAVVVCAGGGGVPVIRDERGELQGVEAVVDKDLTSAVLAEALDADVLLVVTDVKHVMRDFGNPDAAPILRETPAGLRSLDFAAGSMGPKVDAVCRFVELTGGMAAIGSLDDARRHPGRSRPEPSSPPAVGTTQAQRTTFENSLSGPRPADDPQRADACRRLVRARRRDPRGRTHRRRRRREARGWSPDRRASGR